MAGSTWLLVARIGLLVSALAACELVVKSDPGSPVVVGAVR